MATRAEQLEIKDRYVIDTRPIGVVLLSKSYRYFTFAGIGLLWWFIVSLPTPAGLTVEGQRALAIFAVCLILWITHLIPLAVTSLLAIALIPLAGVLDSKEAFATFGNQAVFFILGAFILSAALMKSGLSSRITLWFLRKFGANPKRLLTGILLVPAFLSFWMPEHAVAAMMFPIVLEIAHALEIKPLKHRYGQAMFLSLAWGAAIGGVATFLGGARNALAVGILKETTGQFIGFFEWMVAVVPIVVVMLVFAFVFIRLFHKIDIEDTSKALEVLEKKNRELGRPSFDQRMIGAVMLGTVFSWIFLSKVADLATIAIVAVAVLFVFKLVNWRDLEAYVNWGIILMYGGAIALGFALEKTGAAAWLSKAFMSNIGASSIMILVAFALLAIALTEGMSNAAVVAMLMPVALSIAKANGIDYKAMVYVISVPAGLGFAMPMGNPPNAIAFSSGFIKHRSMFSMGIFLDIIAWVIFIAMALIYWPMIGIKF